MKKRTLTIMAVILTFSVILTACQDTGKDSQSNLGGSNPVVTFKMKSGEVFKAELYPDLAPNTVNNFIYLVKQKFYDGLTFHSILPGLLAHGGCPNGDGTGNAGYTIRGEFKENGFETNTVKHLKGVLTMARNMYSTNSASSQFFIMDKDFPNDTDLINVKYAGFGKIIDGIENFDKVMATELTDEKDDNGNTLGIPVKPPVIECITVDTKGKEYSDPRKFNFSTEVPKYDKELPIVTIEMEDENLEKIELELYPQIAPNTVNNFISLIKKGYYDGLKFHRIIPEFMIQGGDPNGNGSGGPNYNIKEEFNNLSHTSGILSMARSKNVNSAGSQFFIIDMDSDSVFLDGNYTAFGKVISGGDTVRFIAKTELINENEGAPQNLPVMKKVTVDTKGVEYPEPEVIRNEQ